MKTRGKCKDSLTYFYTVWWRSGSPPPPRRTEPKRLFWFQTLHYIVLSLWSLFQTWRRMSQNKVKIVFIYRIRNVKVVLTRRSEGAVSVTPLAPRALKKPGRHWSHFEMILLVSLEMIHVNVQRIGWWRKIQNLEMRGKLKDSKSIRP